jgi:hypothetical protein
MAIQSIQPTDESFCDVLEERDPLLLKQAIEKLVRFGLQVGVTPEEMISLLDSGIDMRDLLAFLAASGAACIRYT